MVNRPWQLPYFYHPAVALGAIVKADDDSDDAVAVVHLGLTGLAY